MLDPLVYFVPPAQRAMGLPRKHIFVDCQHLRGSVTSKIESTSGLHRGLQLCRTCEKRWKRQMGG